MSNVDDFDVSDGELFDGNTIIDLSRVGSSETKSLIMGMLVLPVVLTVLFTYFRRQISDNN